MADNLSGKLLSIIPFKKKAKAGGTSITSTYNPTAADQVLTQPTYRDHLDDIFTSRQADNSQTIMRSLMQADPDVSGTVNGYLTLADTQMIAYVEDIDGNVDVEKSRELQQLIAKLSNQTDFTQGFQLKQGMYRQCEELRYMLLMRGAIGAELVFDKAACPTTSATSTWPRSAGPRSSQASTSPARSWPAARTRSPSTRRPSWSASTGATRPRSTPTRPSSRSSTPWPPGSRSSTTCTGSCA